MCRTAEGHSNTKHDKRKHMNDYTEERKTEKVIEKQESAEKHIDCKLIGSNQK